MRPCQSVNWIEGRFVFSLALALALALARPARQLDARIVLVALWPRVLLKTRQAKVEPHVRAVRKAPAFVESKAPTAAVGVGDKSCRSQTSVSVLVPGTMSCWRCASEV